MTLLELHEKRGRTYKEEAQGLGMNTSNYRKIVLGARMSPETARKIAQYMGYAITEHQLLYPEDYTKTVTPKASPAASIQPQEPAA